MGAILGKKSSKSSVEHSVSQKEGRYGENIAARRIDAGAFVGKWLMVPYEECGRVKTAFIASRVEKIMKRGVVLWKRE